MGIYRIHCNVDGATVYFDSDYKGEIAGGILDVPVYVTGTPYRTFTIEKGGYKTYTGAITSVPGKGQVIDIYAKLSALPLVEYGTLHLLVHPLFPPFILMGLNQEPFHPAGFSSSAMSFPVTMPSRSRRRGMPPRPWKSSWRRMN